jgi:primosomal protein N' (replication factor Y)
MAAETARYVDVAVPLPLSEALTYELPEGFRGQAVPGVRARVRVGKRLSIGIVVRRHDEPPAGISIRPVEAILDREPVLPPALLELADFISDYYLAPIGEVLRSMVPADLSPLGARRIWLTDAGALAAPRDAPEAAIVQALRAAGRIRLADLQREIASPAFLASVDRLAAEGRVGLSEGRRRGARYVTAVELALGDPEELLERCGRSPQGRRVMEHLVALARPATKREIQAAVGCSPAVIRRLIGLGILRSFTQIQRLSLDHQVLQPESVPAIRLRQDQAAAVASLRQALAAGSYAAFLLSGITGSGKTEVYLRAVQAALADGRGAILLVPEIALVPALARQVRQHFGGVLAILHSGLSGVERTQEWERIRRGEARVVLGPRSAVFAPVERLGLVVVDEEQDSSYKQDAVPRYQGRDVALVRGTIEQAVVVSVSATPSLESRRNVEVDKVRPLLLTRRVGQGELPEGILVDLRSEGIARRPGEAHFSLRLQEEISATLEQGDQVILLRNRRGYAPLLLCRSCGADMRCDDCGLPRTYHRRDDLLLCHYCGSRRPVPKQCPDCSEEALEPIGTGTERVEEEFQQLFPGTPVDVLDRDVARRKGSVAGVLERFGRGDTRVLIGTQMVSKGHHFPDVALTAVLLADTYLGFPDFRAVEKTYALLTQLAGRAGRGERPGRVVIQTYHPQHYAIQAALRHDDEGFTEEEMRFRRVFHYPPYTRAVLLLARDRHRGRAEKFLSELAQDLEAHPLARGIRVAGPAPAPFEKLRGKWRFQLLLRAPSGRRVRSLLQAVLPQSPAVDLVIDVDPYELL